MATATKITRKDIKKPDEFITFSRRMLDRIIANKQMLLSVLGVFIFIVAIVTSLQAYSKMKEEKAATLLSEVQALYDNTTDISSPQLPSALMTTPEKEEEALEILKKITDQYSRTAAARIAALFQGQIYYNRGDYDDSRQAYEWLLDKYGGGEEDMTALAWEGLAYCYEAEEKHNKALEAYEKMNQSSPAYLKGWSLLGMARCREKLGEPEKALADYRQFIAEYSDHPKLEEVKANVARMVQLGLGGKSEAGATSEEPTE